MLSWSHYCVISICIVFCIVFVISITLYVKAGENALEPDFKPWEGLLIIPRRARIRVISYLLQFHQWGGAFREQFHAVQCIR